ncbi:MAG: hypothetical protein IMY84_03080 [Chloroflexi bacterium]|nr:hypothetical protein [Chloroflexota bacterium]
MRTDGFRGLLYGLGRFVVSLIHLVYRNERLRLYQLRIDEAGSLPVDAPLERLELHVIETVEDADRLAVQGYENTLLTIPHLARTLDSGAVAVCAFVGVEFASIDWMAFSEDAKRSFDRLPYRVEFENGEACTGGAFTAGRFRGKGIGMYRLSQELLYMRDRGYHVCRNAIPVDNVPSQRCVERLGARFCRVGHYRRVLAWTSWKETPVK